MIRPRPVASELTQGTESDAVFCGSASLQTGALLETTAPAPQAQQLQGLALTAPELFGTLDPHCLRRLSERLQGTGEASSFGEILLLSTEHVYVIQPLPSRPQVAALAVTAATSSVGLVLSAVRRHVAALESR